MSQSLKFLNNSELSSFSEQLSMILHSGISVIEGISIMAEDTPEGSGKALLENLLDSLTKTGCLADALKTSGCFPDYFIKMAGIGETSGTLEDVMGSLSEYYRRRHVLFNTIRDALTYPLILAFMLFAVLAVLVAKVMPVFEEVYAQLGVEASGVTAAVFGAGDVLQWVFAVLLLAAVALILLTLAQLRREDGSKKLLSFFCVIPAVRAIQTQLSRSRFADALSLALHSGLDMDESFALASDMITLPSLKENLTDASKRMKDGVDLCEALRDAGIFSGLDARMASIGFRTGSSEIALRDIAKRCQEDANDKIQAAAGGIEPAITAVLSVLTGLILISVMLPLLSVMASIG